MRTRTYGLLAGMLGGLSAVLIGGGMMSPAAEVPTAFAQETPATNTATTTTTTTTTPVTNTATVTTTTTTTATATQPTATATTATATNTPTGTATTVTATATPTRTNTPVPPTATSVPPTQGPPTQPANAPINLTLSGANEVPPVSSPGTGKFLATTTNTSLSYTLTASGTTSGITMAHIHQGAPGTNGPIVADLIVPVPTGVGSINQSGIITAASLKGPLAGADFATFLTALRAGQLYVNVHTLQNPAGELRANFPAPPAPPATGSTPVETSSGSQSMLYLAGALAGAGALAFGAGAFARRKR